MINTDRFGANFRCERAMQFEQPHYVKCHYGCDHHACATVLGRSYALDIPKSHISAMIAGAMCMLDANAHRSLQDCLMSCIQERLEIRVGTPPAGHCRDHQAALYDCFLGPVVKKPGRDQVKKLRSRWLLTQFFNGDLESETIEFWTTALHPDRENILQAFRRYIVPCLLPGKAPIFPRRRWTNSETCMEYFGLLDCHHQLLAPLVRSWLRKHGHKVSENQAPDIEEAMVVEGWGALLMAGEANPTPFDAAAAAEEDCQEPDGEGHHAAIGRAAVADSEMDKKKKWQEERRQWRSKFSVWSATHPAPILFLMRLAIDPVVKLTYALLRLVGDDWEKEQEQKVIKGGERSFPVLEAARGTLLTDFWSGLREAFHKELVGLPMRAWTRKHQCLLFRLLSCLGTSMALRMQARWQSFPIRLLLGLRVFRTNFFGFWNRPSRS